MSVIQQAATVPILRPLVGMDKQEIIDEARRIGTFEISSIPDQDCCQLFMPKHPATKARPDEVAEAETRFNVTELVSYGVEQASREEFSFPSPGETSAETANSPPPGLPLARK
jgi:thiamine biosynthesis protein ThiI